VGGVVFDHRTQAIQDPTTDRAALRDALRDAMKPSGGTATGDALAASLAMLDAQRGTGAKRPPGAIVLLSDGESTSGRDPVAVAEEARRAGVPVYTVALGTPAGTLPDGQPVPPDTASLRAIAERSGGEAFTAQDAGGLSAVYERLGSQVAMKEEPREITGAFAGGAIALLLAGGGLSLRWFRRLI
jgi:Ca-activated chloride channel family protein